MLENQVSILLYIKAIKKHNVVKLMHLILSLLQKGTEDITASYVHSRKKQSQKTNPTEIAIIFENFIKDFY